MIESDRVNSMSKGELFTRNSIIFVISLAISLAISFAISFAIRRLVGEKYRLRRIEAVQHMCWIQAA